MKVSNNIYAIQDLLELIEQTEDMIQLHKREGTAFMREQYEDRKERFMKELLVELTDAKSLSHDMGIIMLSLKKFYPQLMKVAKKEKIKKEKQKELKTLQEVFA